MARVPQASRGQIKESVASGRPKNVFLLVATICANELPWLRWPGLLGRVAQAGLQGSNPNANPILPTPRHTAARSELSVQEPKKKLLLRVGSVGALLSHTACCQACWVFCACLRSARPLSVARLEYAKTMFVPSLAPAPGLCAGAFQYFGDKEVCNSQAGILQIHVAGTRCCSQHGIPEAVGPPKSHLSQGRCGPARVGSPGVPLQPDERPNRRHLHHEQARSYENGQGSNALAPAPT